MTAKTKAKPSPHSVGDKAYVRRDEAVEHVPNHQKTRGVAAKAYPVHRGMEMIDHQVHRHRGAGLGAHQVPLRGRHQAPL